MKLKNKDMKFYIGTYAKATQDTSLDINILVLYKIRKNFQKIEDALKPYGDTVKEIVEKSKDNIEIAEGISKLGEVEVDVDIEKISITEFGDDVKTSPPFVNSIFFMLKD